MPSLGLLLAALPVALAQTSAYIPLPPGTPFPDTTYPNATDPYAEPGAKTNETSPPSYPSPWGTGMGGWEEAYAKARAFVSNLTLPEKVNLTTGVGWEMEKCVGNTGSIPRLGFAALCLEDSPLGVRDTDFNSAFSAGVTAAATWDRQLIYQRGFDMGSEHKDKGTDVQLGPVVGPIGRVPEGGRNWEGFSPDPVLSSVAVAATIQGMQDAGIMACTKHYIGYEQEHFREQDPPSWYGQGYSSNIDDATMHELYLWPFAEAVRAGTASIMCSYNQINNSYGSQNSYTLNYLLKNELGFQGFVVSDWSAQHDGVASALAGLDMSMPGDVSFDSGTSFWGANLTVAVLNGTVPEWRIDDMAVRIMAGYYYVDRPNNMVANAPTFSAWTTDTYGAQHWWSQQGYTQINYHVNVQKNHYKGIRKMAAAGTVLLKNTGALPMTGKEKLVAVFGSDSAENLWGPNGDPDRGGDNGTLAMGWGSGTANFPYLITPLEAIKHHVRAHHGNIESVTDDYAYAQALALATRVGQPGVDGTCIVFGNADSGEEYIVVDDNYGDRNNLTMWHNATGLVLTVASVCPNTVVVMHTTGAVLVDAFYEHPNVSAILWAGIPGQESGNAITDILYGKINPGGKTPFTWGAARGDYTADVLYHPNQGNFAPQLDFDEGPFIDYFGFDKFGATPIYEFGFGMSYTNFSFSNLQVTTHQISPYLPSSGQTPAAGTYGQISNQTSQYLCSDEAQRITNYIYPCLNSTSLKSSSGDPQYGDQVTLPKGSQDGSPQPILPAGGAPGGNPQLYDIVFTVTADIQNTGSVVGDEVPQLYVSLGGPQNPPVQLRDFDRITIQPGQTQTFNGTITRKDLSNWDVATQDWVITNYTKTVYVGNSSRNLPLTAVLNIPAGAYYGSGTSNPSTYGGSSPSSYGGSSVASSSGSANTMTHHHHTRTAIGTRPPHQTRTSTVTEASSTPTSSS